MGSIFWFLRDVGGVELSNSPIFAAITTPPPIHFIFGFFVTVTSLFSFLKADFWSEKNLYRMNTKWAEFKISTWIDLYRLNSAISQAEPGLVGTIGFEVDFND